MPDYDPRTDPNLQRPRPDDPVLQPAAPSRGLYLVVGVVAAIVAVVGLMFLTGPVNDRSDLARTPDPATINAPDQGTRTPTIPARPMERQPDETRPTETLPAPERQP